MANRPRSVRKPWLSVKAHSERHKGTLPKVVNQSANTSNKTKGCQGRRMAFEKGRKKAGKAVR
jgi:hypothetical protein